MKKTQVLIISFVGFIIIFSFSMYFSRTAQRRIGVERNLQFKVASALEVYRNEYGDYPERIDIPIIPSSILNECEIVPDGNGIIVDTYLRPYVIVNSRDVYVIVSKGENGDFEYSENDGTGDDIYTPFSK